MQKKVIAGIIAVLVVVAAALAFVNRSGGKNVSGLVLAGGGKEVTVAWEDVGAQSFDGDLVNGKGEVSHHEYTGAELLEAGKVYVALTDGGKQIEGIEGGQGAQLIVFGDQNSKRAVRYLKTISVK